MCLIGPAAEERGDEASELGKVVNRAPGRGRPGAYSVFPSYRTHLITMSQHEQERLRQWRLSEKKQRLSKVGKKKRLNNNIWLRYGL